MKVINSLIPGMVPYALGWGKYSDPDPERYFFAVQFSRTKHFSCGSSKICCWVVELHRKGESPNGMFGFPVVTYNGALAHSVAWEKNWTTFFTTMLKVGLDYDKRENGHWPELEVVAGSSWKGHWQGDSPAFRRTTIKWPSDQAEPPSWRLMVWKCRNWRQDWRDCFLWHSCTLAHFTTSSTFYCWRYMTGNSTADCCCKIATWLGLVSTLIASFCASESSGKRKMVTGISGGPLLKWLQPQSSLL